MRRGALSAVLVACAGLASKRNEERFLGEEEEGQEQQIGWHESPEIAR
jgi:hypothetical protein